MKLLAAILTAFLFLSPVAFAKGRPKTYCESCSRDKRGRIERSSSERMKFLKSKGLSHTPPGYQVDHIIPLSKGGCDCVENMQLIPKDSEKERNELK